MEIIPGRLSRALSVNVKKTNCTDVCVGPESPGTCKEIDLSLRPGPTDTADVDVGCFRAEIIWVVGIIFVLTFNASGDQHCKK